MFVCAATEPPDRKHRQDLFFRPEHRAAPTPTSEDQLANTLRTHPLILAKTERYQETFCCSLNLRWVSLADYIGAERGAGLT